MIQICRDHATNVKRWRDGQMVLRWIAAGMGEARQQFRRVNGYLHLPAPRAALDATIATVTPTKGGCRRLISTGPPSNPHGTRDNLPSSCRQHYSWRSRAGRAGRPAP